jgi:DNA-3-methyladenine glycosylase I
MITGPMPGPDGLLRCPWALSATEYLAYHDNEWGRPVTSVQGLAPLSGVAALLAGWTQLGVAFLLLGIAALLGGVALLYCPELPRRLLAWLIKRDDPPLTADGDDRD